MSGTPNHSSPSPLKTYIVPIETGMPGETSPLYFLWDPDGFGGPEDRAPWADVARDRARVAR